MDHRFQVNLSGIIELLSNNLYSGPEVCFRELLQNAVDAITARCAIEPGFEGGVRLEVVRGASVPPTLTCEDDGVGLTEEEVHQFLATIGESSKRGGVISRPISSDSSALGCSRASCWPTKS